jgi:hypothetical protein
MSVVVVTMPGGIMAVVREGRVKGGKGVGEKCKGKGGGGPRTPTGRGSGKGAVYYPFKSWQKTSSPANSSQQSAPPSSSSPTGGGNLSGPPLVM